MNDQPARLTAGMFTNRTDEWGTPRALFDALNAEFRFDLDPCASAINAKCARFFTQEDNGLFQDWGGSRVFVNPPYSASADWLKKAYEESREPGTVVVVLIPCRTDTKYFHDFCMKADEIRLIKGRLKYNDSLQSAPFPSALFIFDLSNHPNRSPRLVACDAKGKLI